MFALIALIIFVLAMFRVTLGGLNMLAMGLALISLHLCVGTWPFGAFTVSRKE